MQPAAPQRFSKMVPLMLSLLRRRGRETHIHHGIVRRVPDGFCGIRPPVLVAGARTRTYSAWKPPIHHAPSEALIRRHAHRLAPKSLVVPIECRVMRLVPRRRSKEQGCEGERRARCWPSSSLPGTLRGGSSTGRLLFSLHLCRDREVSHLRVSLDAQDSSNGKSLESKPSSYQLINDDGGV